MTHHAPPGGTMTRPQIDEHLAFTDAHCDSDDPYLQAHAYECACKAYDALAAYQADPLLRMACHQAAVMYATRAAHIRFENGIPTTRPMTEAELLNLDRRVCLSCGSPWRIPAGDQRCPDCPQLLFGPTPTSQAEVGKYPPPTVVDVSMWTAGHPEE